MKKVFRLVSFFAIVHLLAGVASAQQTSASSPPHWAREAIWYQIFPERFRNGDPSNDPMLDIPSWKIKDWGGDYYEMDTWETLNGNIFQTIQDRRYGGDIQGILDKLDYLQDLGVTALYLNPVFQSLSHHKYNGSTFHHVDPHFGPDPKGDLYLIQAANETLDPKTWVWTKADLLYLKLVKEVHVRGMKIIMDGVFNHSGREFFAFKDILKNGQNSKYRNWYDILRWDPTLSDGFDYRGWFGHKIAPEFKEDRSGFHPEYFKYLEDITNRWMAPFGRKEDGIDGWRLDVAFDVQHQFWKKWRKIVKSINPEAYLTAELWQVAPEYLQGDEFDALMNYPFAHSISEFIVDQTNKISPSEFDRSLKLLQNSYSSESNLVMQNLVGSHDTARIRSQILNPDLNTRNTSVNFPNTQIINNPRYNLSRGETIHQNIHKLVAFFQMTYLGAPFIYYGDEVGMTGANDPDCRKPMIWPDIPFEDEIAHPTLSRRDLIAKNVIETELFDYYKTLIRIKKSSKPLTEGSFHTFLVDDSKGLYGFYRQWSNERVYAVINSSLMDSQFRFPENGAYRDLIKNEVYTVKVGEELQIPAKTGVLLMKL